MRGVHAVYTNRARLESGVLSLRLIEQVALLMVILFISLEFVPPGLFTPTSGCPGHSVWTGDYTNGWRAGRGEGGAAGNGAPGRHAGWASREEGAGLSWAQPLTLGGKETCLPAIGSFGLRWSGGWRCLLPRGPYPSSLKADSELEVVLLGCSHINK